MPTQAGLPPGAPCWGDSMGWPRLGSACRGHFNAVRIRNFYLWPMLKAFEFCIPTRGTEVPSSPDWLQEIKFDGYRLRVERNGDRVRLITRGGLRGHVSRYDLGVKKTLLVALI